MNGTLGQRNVFAVARFPTVHRRWDKGVKDDFADKMTLAQIPILHQTPSASPRFGQGPSFVLGTRQCGSRHGHQAGRHAMDHFALDVELVQGTTLPVQIKEFASCHRIVPPVAPAFVRPTPCRFCVLDAVIDERRIE